MTLDTTPERSRVQLEDEWSRVISAAAHDTPEQYEGGGGGAGCGRRASRDRRGASFVNRGLETSKEEIQSVNEELTTSIR
jgi:hypothetical protein